MRALYELRATRALPAGVSVPLIAPTAPFADQFRPQLPVLGCAVIAHLCPLIVCFADFQFRAREASGVDARVTGASLAGADKRTVSALR